MNWLDHKNELCRQSLLADCFLQSVDQVVLQDLQEQEQPVVQYSARHFEQLLRDVGVLCDRMVTYRREMQDLEILAVRAATDRMVHLTSRSFERELAELQLGKNRSQDREKYAHEVGDLFKKLEDPLAPGFVADFEARARLANGEAVEADMQLGYLGQRWKLTDTVSDSYWERHNTPGNAHNYVYRWGWTRRLLAEDLRESYAKAKGIFAGMRLFIDSASPEPPSSNSISYLDELILWTRSCFRSLERYEDSAQEFDLTIPLVQPFGESGAVLISPEEFNERVDKAAARPGTPLVLEFDLTGHLAISAGMRLRSLALSFSTEPDLDRSSGTDRAAPRTSRAILQAFLEFPEQISSATYRERIPRIHLGRVVAYEGSQNYGFVGGKLVHNVVLRGKWVVSLLPFATFQGSEVCQPFVDLATYRLADLKLHIRGFGRSPS